MCNLTSKTVAVRSELLERIMEGNSEIDPLGFKPSNKKPTLSPLPPTPGPRPEDECYDMSHPNRGIALIFNHRFFDHPLNKDRLGTEFDQEAMNDVLKTLGFHVEVYEDFNRKQIFEALTVVSKMDHSTNDCLIVAVMTHGKSYGRLSAKDEDYTTSDLVEFFSGSNCPSLAGKPKLFFIQACRGERTDPGVQIQSDNGGDEVEKIVYTIPAMADILIMYATVEGFFAWRDTKKGACFIQSLASKLGTHHKNRDLLSILTMVNREVAIGFESMSQYPALDNKKAMCSIVSMLTRTLYF